MFRTCLSVSFAVVQEDCIGGHIIEVLMTRIRLGQILYCFMVAYKAACQPIKGLGVCKDIAEVLLVLETMTAIISLTF